MHIDLDAFYASVEQRENPELKGRPVVIGADPKNGQGRGVVATCSYEARKFGIKSAMPISKAWKLCPQGIYLRPNFPLYARVSNNIMAIARKYADKFEQMSIDEAFLDVTNKARDLEDASRLAEKLKEEIMGKEKISSSVGIGPNKLIAKLASDFKKPDGLIVVKPEDVEKFINPLDAGDLPGIGPKTEAILKEMKIETVEQLGKINAEDLARIFGKFGHRMHEMARGIDQSEVTEEYEIKSVGREVTFEEDVQDSKVIMNSIEKLVDEFHQEIISENMQFKTVGIKIRYENFETHTRAKTFPYYTNEKNTIINTAKDLVVPFLNRMKIRLVGVRVSGLKFGGYQKTLKDV